MRLLFTGGSGFLGNSILKEVDKICAVSILSRSKGEYKLSLENDIPRFNLYFDIVIHAAGKAHSNPKTESERQQYYNINVVGTQNLLKGLTKSGVPKNFVFISSVSVYGKDFGNNIDENTYLGAVDAYGVSKIEAERMVLAWCKEHKVVCTILRLPLIIGPNPPGNLGSMIKGIRKGFYFNIAGGMAKKSMVLAEDLAKSVLDIAKIGGIYNLTDGYHPSFAELSNQISIQLGKGKPINMPMWLARIIANLGDLLGSKAPINTNKLKKITSDLTFDDSKARAVFGWNPTPVLEGFNIN
jgi:nucleoside-diphosphate-sugar epimerase